LDEVNGQMFTFIESSAFQRVCRVYLDDGEYSELQQFMMRNPKPAKLFQVQAEFANCAGHGQVGKRGGLRVIYYVRYEPNEFWIVKKKR